MRHRVLQTLRNPLLRIPPLVIFLAIAWQHYAYAGRNLSLPSSGGNILPNGDFARFDGSLPVGWQLIHSGAAQYSTTLADGYVAGKSLELNVHDYRDGDTTLQSPKVSLQQNMTYLFKGYYKTTVPFELLARYYHTDGSSALVLVQSYPGDSSDWSTASDAFASTNITAVQFVYRVSGNGQLSLNGLYLEPQHDIYVPPTVAGQNLIPNSRLATSDASNIPQDWST